MCYSLKMSGGKVTKLLIEKTAITGHEAFFTLRPYCKKLKIENQYALYGFIKWINPQNILCVQNQIGQISYTKTYANPFLLS